ncbi:MULTISPECIES: preprotein translocase subunit YajC [unclassified Curtobacterium]|uniref:preprotein translocase subunit YajC n=1 Tax=unclassified Curtobacterium TaxID=257496 RepID=UPI00105167B9|nr:MULTISPECIES: preprotein translocase subunit YajC [unclassified Curtobacterium]TCL80970.1 preprotein translocase subunit YajC [Curtobacterium sp. PhB128]TCL99095.1 preprotein translocase subunit YajC [Curtobacterium sp. PhB138]
MGQEVILIVIVVAFAAFMFYNSRKRKKQQGELATKMVPGARVMLSFGLYGTLLSVDDEKVTADVEIAPGTVVTVHRQTLSRVVDDSASDIETTATAEDEAKPVAELNGEPVYGERVDNDRLDETDSKRKSDD